MIVNSVNVGPAVPREIHGRRVMTAIAKHPVLGPVAVGPLGLTGDEQADLNLHGGLSKAVYAYAAEHYAFWQTVRAQARVSLWDEAPPPGSVGENLTVPGPREFHGGGLLLLTALTAAGIALVRRLGGPNPWVLGSLLVSIVLTALDVQLTAMPKPLSNAGQLFIGVALGARFTPDFVRTAPRWLGCVALGTLGMILASALFAWVLAWVTGQNPATLMLGTSPGGIAEMCITAKVLQLGVPTVTALHVIRFVVVLLATERLWGWEARRLGMVSNASSPA